MVVHGEDQPLCTCNALSSNKQQQMVGFWKACKTEVHFSLVHVYILCSPVFAFNDHFLHLTVGLLWPIKKLFCVVSNFVMCSLALIGGIFWRTRGELCWQPVPTFATVRGESKRPWGIMLVSPPCCCPGNPPPHPYCIFPVIMKWNASLFGHKWKTAWQRGSANVSFCANKN